jgi:radical SAM enzyme (TIGR01210 family)
LEVALGLETIHPEVLPRLNKRMTVEDFDSAVRLLRGNDIAVRAFVLLRPPFLSEGEGIEWALKSIRHAFDIGVGCCSVIPTRSGNGIMDRLVQRGEFTPPKLSSLIQVQATALEWRSGRVFADLWDAGQFADCEKCRDDQMAALRKMNLTQQPIAIPSCECGMQPS